MNARYTRQDQSAAQGELGSIDRSSRSGIERGRRSVVNDDRSSSPGGKLDVGSPDRDPRQFDDPDNSARGRLDRWDVSLRGYLEQHAQESFAKHLLRPDPLNEKNWRIYAARHYSNPQCIGEEEFNQDLKRIKYVKKALTKYKMTGELGEKNILNHLIVLYNVFGAEHMCRIVFLKMSEHLVFIKPFLVLMRVLPPVVTDVAGRDWVTDDIAMDEKVVAALRRL